MVLSEERHEQIRHTWYSRFARERRDLSVSVTETLVDSISQKSWVEDVSGRTTTVRAAPRRILFPPRLSLRSRPMPALCSGEGPACVRTDQDGCPQATQTTGALARFAQRLTSSLAAIGRGESGASSRPEKSLSSTDQYDFSFAPLAVMEDTIESPAPVTSSFAGLWPYMPSPARQVCPSKPGQRLAGHIMKIRLESVFPRREDRPTRPVPVEKQMVKRTSTPPVVRGASAETSTHLPAIRHDIPEMTIPTLPAVAHVQTAVEMTIPTLPVVTRVQKDPGMTSTHLPAIAPLARTGSETAKRETLAGSGVFEYGQRDVIIANSQVTASSVVLTMLTANPGPVVVQYVTLQPGVGFTLHLSAPTTMKTSFNYIIFP